MYMRAVTCAVDAAHDLVFTYKFGSLHCALVTQCKVFI